MMPKAYRGLKIFFQGTFKSRRLGLSFWGNMVRCRRFSLEIEYVGTIPTDMEYRCITISIGNVN